jgi:hypothetical protein
MHCSICGQANHNNKGYANFILSQQEDGEEWEDNLDDPSILQKKCNTIHFLHRCNSPASTPM